MGYTFRLGAVERRNFLNGQRDLFQSDDEPKCAMLCEIDNAFYLPAIMGLHASSRDDKDKLVAAYGQELYDVYASSHDGDRLLPPDAIDVALATINALEERVRNMPFDECPEDANRCNWAGTTMVRNGDNERLKLIASASDRIEVVKFTKEEEDNRTGNPTTWIGGEGYSNYFFGTDANISVVREVCRTIGHSRHYHFNYPWEMPPSDPDFGMSNTKSLLRQAKGTLDMIGKEKVVLLLNII